MIIVANLHNTQTGRYQPIFFRESPLPGQGFGVNPAGRYKSGGHHTKGFDSRKEALAECEKMSQKIDGDLCVEKDFPWDGEEMPVMVVFFSKVNGQWQPG